MNWIQKHESMDHDRWMRLAIEESHRAPRADTAYSVGAVLVSSEGNLLSTGHSREQQGNTHAEQVCLLKQSDITVTRNATIYSTMEPCSVRNSGNYPCARRIIDAQISTVVYGIKEPPHLVANCTGIQMLHDAGIQTIHLSEYYGKPKAMFIKPLISNAN